MSKRVFLDAGHGGKDPGAVNGSRKEKDDVLKLTNRLRDLLIEQGVKVSVSRTTDKYLTVSERVKRANNSGADYFASLHRNSFSSASAKGAEVWVYSKTSPDTVKKAQRIQDELVKIGFTDRKVKKGAPSYNDFGVNRDTTMPACLIEIGFISNAGDNKLFDNKFEDMAKGLAKALCANVGVKYQEKKKEPTATFKKGDIVEIKQGATWYNSSSSVPAWALSKKWIVAQVYGARAVVNKDTTDNYSINSPIDVKYLSLVKEPTQPRPEPKPESKPETPKEPDKPKEKEEPNEQDEATETLIDKIINMLRELLKGLK